MLFSPPLFTIFTPLEPEQGVLYNLYGINIWQLYRFGTTPHHSYYNFTTNIENCLILDRIWWVLRVKYPSAKEMFTALQLKARTLKFSLSIFRSDYKKWKMIAVCDRAGSYKSVTVARKTKTKRTGCLYRLTARQIGVDKMWKVTRHGGAHNHGMSTNLNMHSRARRLTIE